MKSKLRLLAIPAFLFGVATLVSGGKQLFGGPDQLSEGAVVPFVLMFNFVAGFFYIAAAVGIFTGRPWAKGLAAVLAVASAFVFAMLGVHIAFGRAFQMKTVAAMTVRTGFWAIMTWILVKNARKSVEPATPSAS